MLLIACGAAHAQGSDARTLVELPAPMRAHMLANMRDHLAALGEIQTALGRGDFDAAARTAEERLGASSLASHGAAHMAPHMPEAMRSIGTGMHRAASRFARTAQEAAVERDTARAVAALAEINAQCVACHAGYRVQ